MPATPKPLRFPLGLTITVVIALGILLGLGVWQLKRLAWKTDLLAQIEQAKTGPAFPLDAALMLPHPEFHRVSVECPGLGGAAYIWIHAIVDGQQGRRLVSACPLVRGSILVDRGFVGDQTTAAPQISSNAAPFSVPGVLLKGETKGLFTPPPSDGLFFNHNVAAMAAALKAPEPGAYFIAAETSANPEFPALKPIPLPTDIPNNHFQYALTWFGLAAALLAIYAAKLTPWLRARFKR